MATLTASGVTTSSGQLDGYYTGTSATNTSFPLGQVLYAYFSGAVAGYPFGNASARTTTSNYQQGYIYWNTAGGTALAGTWKCIGGNNMDTCSNPMRIGPGYVLMQRVA